MLKKEVQQVITDASQKVDNETFSNLFTAVTAGMVAMSAYAYIV